MIRFLLCAALLLVNATALGADPVRKQVESSMLVTGRIQVDAEGKVSGFSLDKEELLPPGITDLAHKAVPGWKFEPTLHEGKPTALATAMNLLFVAKKVGEDSYTLSIRGASFGEQSTESGAAITHRNLAAPTYPESAFIAHATGTVYVLVKVGRGGLAEDAAVEQVNLKFLASERRMEHWRYVLADNALKQARQWTFNPPTVGEEANDDFWVVRVPVVYDMGDKRSTSYGKWETYVPGPRYPSPWKTQRNDSLAFSPDALPPGGVYLAGSGLKLLTALGG